MTTDEFLARLEGVQGAQGGWIARCPGHADSSPSLSISEGTEGVLVKCHAGCDTPSVVAAMGLEMRDLFYTSRSSGIRKNLTAEYDYHDEAGRFVFRVDRLEWFEGGERRKSFLQKRLVDGEWVYGVEGVRLVPYKLPRLLYAIRHFRTVYFVEGEKDVESWTRRGYFATTFPGGAKKMLPRYVKYFVGLHRLVIVRDKDEAGAKHAELVRDALEGIVPHIEVVEAAIGKDSTDHLDSGLGPGELVVVQ